MLNSQNGEWICSLKEKVALFIKKMKNEKKGHYKYSLNGDTLPKNLHWGLGNSVFALKIIYTLNLEERFSKETELIIDYIMTFQKKDGYFYDPYVRFLSMPARILGAVKHKDLKILSYKKTKRAETRQSISALNLFNKKPKYNFSDFPEEKKSIKEYIDGLDWKRPWHAGANFSHLLFFISNSNLKDKDELIKYSLEIIERLRKKDGFWYQGEPTVQQKINGAMKIITGMNAARKIDIKNPFKLIDLCLSVKNDKHACDNFNIVYVLKYANESTKSQYRYDEIVQFMNERIKTYKEYYHEDEGGFSFTKHRANISYYGAILSRGKNVPDIHGTILFLWGLSIISQVLKTDTGLKEHMT